MKWFINALVHVLAGLFASAIGAFTINGVVGFAFVLALESISYVSHKPFATYWHFIWAVIYVTCLAYTNRLHIDLADTVCFGLYHVCTSVPLSFIIDEIWNYWFVQRTSGISFSIVLAQDIALLTCAFATARVFKTSIAYECTRMDIALLHCLSFVSAMSAWVVREIKLTKIDSPKSCAIQGTHAKKAVALAKYFVLSYIVCLLKKYTGSNCVYVVTNFILWRSIVTNDILHTSTILTACLIGSCVACMTNVALMAVNDGPSRLVIGFSKIEANETNLSIFRMLHTTIITIYMIESNHSLRNIFPKTIDLKELLKYFFTRGYLTKDLSASVLSRPLDDSEVGTQLTEGFCGVAWHADFLMIKNQLYDILLSSMGEGDNSFLPKIQEGIFNLTSCDGIVIIYHLLPSCEEMSNTRYLLNVSEETYKQLSERLCYYTRKLECGGMTRISGQLVNLTIKWKPRETIHCKCPELEDLNQNELVKDKICKKRETNTHILHAPLTAEMENDYNYGVSLFGILSDDRTHVMKIGKPDVYVSITIFAKRKIKLSQTQTNILRMFTNLLINKYVRDKSLAELNADIDSLGRQIEDIRTQESMRDNYYIKGYRMIKQIIRMMPQAKTNKFLLGDFRTLFKLISVKSYETPNEPVSEESTCSIPLAETLKDQKFAYYNYLVDSIQRSLNIYTLSGPFIIHNYALFFARFIWESTLKRYCVPSYVISANIDYSYCTKFKPISLALLYVIIMHMENNPLEIQIKFYVPHENDIRYLRVPKRKSGITVSGGKEQFSKQQDTKDTKLSSVVRDNGDVLITSAKKKQPKATVSKLGLEVTMESDISRENSIFPQSTSAAIASPVPLQEVTKSTFITPYPSPSEHIRLARANGWMAVKVKESASHYSVIDKLNESTKHEHIEKYYRYFTRIFTHLILTHGQDGTNAKPIVKPNVLFITAMNNCVADFDGTYECKNTSDIRESTICFPVTQLAGKQIGKYYRIVRDVRTRMKPGVVIAVISQYEFEHKAYKRVLDDCGTMVIKFMSVVSAVSYFVAATSYPQLVFMDASFLKHEVLVGLKAKTKVIVISNEPEPGYTALVRPFNRVLLLKAIIKALDLR